jgi:hypothetical protein
VSNILSTFFETRFENIRKLRRRGSRCLSHWMPLRTPTKERGGSDRQTDKLWIFYLRTRLSALHSTGRLLCPLPVHTLGFPFVHAPLNPPRGSYILIWATSLFSLDFPSRGENVTTRLLLVGGFSGGLQTGLCDVRSDMRDAPNGHREYICDCFPLKRRWFGL